MTQATTWIQYLALLIYFTNAKEPIPRMDNPHVSIILSKPLPPISEPQRRRIDFSIWSNSNKQKYFSGSNLSNNLYWSYSDKLYTGWLLSSTQIWPRFNCCIVFSTISMQLCWASSVCTGPSIEGKIADMSGFIVCWLLWKWYRVHAGSASIFKGD